MYEWNEEEKKIDFSHNPFSMPNYPLNMFLELDPSDAEQAQKITAFQYDIVCNGVELSSGALGNLRPEVMRKAYAFAGYDEWVLEDKFGGMLRALQYGAPPHGGIAPGIDRIVMLLCGEENLREVVLFPMNQRAEDLLMGAPSEATAKQLRELHIRLNLPQKESRSQTRYFSTNSAHLSTAPAPPHGMIGTVEVEFFGEPSMMRSE
jgi:aspartyl-tRNA synthetase